MKVYSSVKRQRNKVLREKQKTKTMKQILHRVTTTETQMGTSRNSYLKELEEVIHLITASNLTSLHFDNKEVYKKERE